MVTIRSLIVKFKNSGLSLSQDQNLGRYGGNFPLSYGKHSPGNGPIQRLGLGPFTELCTITSPTSLSKRRLRQLDIHRIFPFGKMAAPLNGKPPSKSWRKGDFGHVGVTPKAGLLTHGFPRRCIAIISFQLTLISTCNNDAFSFAFYSEAPWNFPSIMPFPSRYCTKQVGKLMLSSLHLRADNTLSITSIIYFFQKKVGST
jgi:hypothetical protein